MYSCSLLGNPCELSQSRSKFTDLTFQLGTKLLKNLVTLPDQVEMQ